jgi:hypothetical protein
MLLNAMISPQTQEELLLAIHSHLSLGGSSRHLSLAHLKEAADDELKRRLARDLVEDLNDATLEKIAIGGFDEGALSEEIQKLTADVAARNQRRVESELANASSADLFVLSEHRQPKNEAP